MPLYFFDVSYDNGPWDLDPDGTALASQSDARTAAFELVAEVAKDELKRHPVITVQVRDHDPKPFFTLSVSAEPP